ncbi:MAG: TGS domain-containing protein [Verrucomicrobiia bacterium]
MPTNVTPEYEKAEQRYREATTDAERIAALEQMLATIPKHKGTEKMQADIKRRLSQLRKEQQKAKRASKGPDPFHIPKSGAGQVVLIGPPNTGKSSILAVTTHAPAKVAEYPFTTTIPQPGIWEKEKVPIELVDTPAITIERVPTGLMGTIRNSDIVCVVVEACAEAVEQAESTLSVLSERGLSLRTVPINVRSLSESTLKSGLIVANKADLDREGTVAALRELYAPGIDVLGVSTKTGEGLDALFQRLWSLLAVIRVYAKQPSKPPDMQKPFILPAGSTVVDLARKIHRDLPDRMKYARLWGHACFAGQQVHSSEPLQDGDVVEIHE